MTKKEDIDKIIKSIKNKRNAIMNSYLPIKRDSPLHNQVKIATMLMDQRDFIYRETLTLTLMELYAVNTSMFNHIIGKELRKEIKYNENYIDECIPLIAYMVYVGNVRVINSEINSVWTTSKSRHDVVLSMDQAITICCDFIQPDA